MSGPALRVEGPDATLAASCERILRSLPEWFGIEDALVAYAHDTARFPTFVARDAGRVVGFATLREHFPQAWELHCIAVERDAHGRGVGRALHAHGEAWLRARGVRLLQVKTIADAHPSEAYARTREFYRAIGYIPVETFPALWDPELPVLQLVKALG
jgi:GNAT superfamily N-acetyltransferase